MNAKDYLDWLLGGAKPTDASNDFQWAVVQATDTLVWCLREGDAWRRTDLEPGSGVRSLKADRIFEARFFGPSEQLLLWRDDGGEWFHSLLTSASGEWHKDKLTFVGNPQTLGESGFDCRTDLAGRVSVVPQGEFLKIAQLLEEDPETGLVRIAATRFVEIVEK